MPKTSSRILGISFGHGDSSAALVIDGELVAAAEEERFSRVKHDARFPARAIAYCLEHAGIRASDVETVAIAKRPLAHLGRRLRLLWSHPHLLSRKGADSEKEQLGRSLKAAGLRRARIRRVEHHLAHMASARMLVPNEEVALLSFDGLGDFVSASIGRSRGVRSDNIEVLDRVFFPHSLGYFYTAMTQFLGFPHFGDEFKVMGLSSYGQARHMPALRELIRSKEGFGFELNLEAFPILKEPMRFYVKNSQPVCEPFFNRNLLTQMLGISPRKPGDPLTQAHRDLAKSVQERFEELANAMLNELYRRVACHTLALAGGCAHNSVWVGKIPSVTPFQKLFVAPAAHDAGIAVGAAALAARTDVHVGAATHPALLGPSGEELSGRIDDQRPPGLPFEVAEKRFSDEASLIRWIVEELSQKKIVGLLHGRMEFGPRALGSRSILADPRWPEMKDRLNARVKHRESFRPFAASVLVEHQNDWFTGAFHAPTMEAVFEVKPAKRPRIPAVVHVDNSCRIQSVSRDRQPFYWSLIEAFRQKTGIPMLVNTSFNDSEPIVCSEKDAWNCFAHSELDHLVLGTRVFSRVRQAVVQPRIEKMAMSA